MILRIFQTSPTIEAIIHTLSVHTLVKPPELEKREARGKRRK